MMKNLPVPVSDEEIEEMYLFADNNNNGKISYKEFRVGTLNSIVRSVITSSFL